MSGAELVSPPSEVAALGLVLRGRDRSVVRGARLVAAAEAALALEDDPAAVVAKRRGPGSMIHLACTMTAVREHAETAAKVSNKAIGERLVITEAAVRKHVGAIFARLAVRRRAHRGILAVLVYLSRYRAG